MKINRIKLKIVLLIFITLIPVSILRFIDIRKDKEFRIKAELEANQDYAEAISLAFMNFLDRTWSSQFIIGKAFIEYQDVITEEFIDGFNNLTSGDKPYNMNYYWATADGNMYLGSQRSKKWLDVTGRSFYKEIVKGKDKVLGDLEYSAVNGELIIPIARGIRVDGELKGIVVNTLNTKDMKHIIPINRMGKGSFIGLADNNANIVFRNGDNDILVSKIEVASEDSPIRKALEGDIVKTYSRFSQYDGIERMGIDYPIKEIGWVSFVGTPVERVLGNIRESTIRSLITFGIIYIISFIMAIMTSRNFIKSIGKLKLAAQKVKSGDLDAKTDIGIEDDLGDVGQAFDNMVEALKIKAKEVEEYNDLKSQFLITISHEFKTPLNIILGCIQLLEDSDINDRKEFQENLHKYIKMQRQNSYRLLRLISNFIDITKIEHNHMEPRLCNYNIVNVVENITMSIIDYTKLKDINIIFDTDMEERIIAFDPEMVERIMLNLLSNSIKFTERGGEIRVNIINEKEQVLISVKDNGIGIPEDKVEMIFDRFTQVDNSLRRRTEGSGIGLSLVKSLVELHGGTIRVNSQLGVGTEFIFTLPERIVGNYYTDEIEENILNTERILIEFSDIYI